jgi:hypothetical protein
MISGRLPYFTGTLASDQVRNQLATAVLASRSGEVWSAGAVSAEAGMAIAPTYPDFCIEEITGVSTPIARSRDSSSAGQ